MKRVSKFFSKFRLFLLLLILFLFFQLHRLLLNREVVQKIINRFFIQFLFGYCPRFSSSHLFEEYRS